MNDADIKRMIELDEPVARDLVGTAGHYIQAIGDKFGVFDPTGMLLTLKREKSEAERCAREHATTGSITV